MKDKLPTTWTITKVGNLCSQLRGISYQKEDVYSAEFENSVWVLRGGNIQNGKIVANDGDDVYVSKKLVKMEQLVRKGDVIIVSSTGSKALIGKAAHATEDMSTTGFGAFLTLLRPKKEIDNLYFDYFFQTEHYRENIRQLSGGININNIRRSHIDELGFPLPPIDEQIKISKKLDEIFGHLERLNSRLDRIPELINAFTNKVLTYAITGKLTNDWREVNSAVQEFSEVEWNDMREPNHELPSTWIWRPFNNVAFVESNLVEPTHYLNYPLIAPDNIESKSGRLLNKPLVSDIMPKSAKHFFNSGSIIYSKIRPYLSKVIIADFDGLCSADMYPIKTVLNLKYLYYYMLSETFLYYANSSGERTVLPKINQKELGIIPVPIPPLQEQNEIVRRVEGLISISAILKKQLDRLKVNVDALPTNVLSKAFEGRM